jgi:Flp pilus assembly protein TadG
VPFQLNYDQDIGTQGDGDRWQLNVQPVVPVAINEDWNLVSRKILPLVSQSGIDPGAGPVLLLPTGSGDLLTTDPWTAGPKAPGSGTS